MINREKELEKELAQAYENLTNVQRRCSDLITECRALKRENERLIGAVVTLAKSSTPTKLTDVPVVVKKHTGIFSEERPNGVPEGIDQREDGYAPQPKEMRKKNGITKRSKSDWR